MNKYHTEKWCSQPVPYNEIPSIESDLWRPQTVRIQFEYTQTQCQEGTIEMPSFISKIIWEAVFEFV